MKNTILNLKRAAAGLAVAVVASAPAHAALDVAVTTQMADAKEDVLAMGALGLGIVIAIAVYKYLKRGV